MIKKHCALKYITTIICFLWTLAAYSQGNNYTFTGKIFEANTKVQLLECRVEVLSSADSVVIASTTATRKYTSGKDYSYTSEYSLTIPRKEGDYLIRVTKNGYETTWHPVSLRNLYHREYSRSIPNIYIHKEKVINLNEVVVKATKVKFYIKGDTIVYNADAFQLAEGSMLDALIRQLPGAELRANGKIFVNGRFVENLLLNGKDFFKGNNRVLLDNLPNYMVSKIDVYEKRGDDSEFLGREVAGDIRYVMDVKLKKQYSIGMSGNIELGGGSEGYYLARLFAMRFTDHSRLAVYGNANNLNDDNKPGEHGNWSPSKLLGGVTTQQIGGLDYNISDRNGRYKLSGNVHLKHAGNEIDNKIFQTNFLSEGDVYSRMTNNATNNTFSLSTNHRFYFEWEKANFEILPDLSYNNFRNRNSYSAITSDDNTIFGSNVSADSLFGKHLANAYKKYAINRNIKQSKKDGYGWMTSIAFKSKIKFNRIPDNLTLYAKASYTNTKEEVFDHNRIEYYSLGNVSSTDFRNRYFDIKPSRGHSLMTKATYTYIMNNNLFIDISYSFNRDYSKSASGLYMLNKLAGWGENTLEELGALPSYTEYIHTIDKANSYDSKQETNKSTIEPFLVWKQETEKSVWRAQLAVPASIQHRSYTYHRGSVDTTFTKRNPLINIYSSYLKWSSKDRKYEAQLQYALNSKTPDMNMYLDVYDTTDPLNIRVGNSELRTSMSHRIITSFIRMYPKKRLMWAIEGVFKPVQNAIAMGYSYNKQTGVKTYKPENVNGCWSGDLSAGMSCPIGKQKKLNLKSMLGVGYIRNVDFIETIGVSVSSRSIVETRNLTEMMQLKYGIGKSSIGIKSEGTWRRSTSTREDFTTINTTELKNGFTALLQLPWNLQLSTDMTLYTRRGYVNTNMNTDDWVWNARLSYPFARGMCLIQLDGYDILRQLSNITHTLNAQGIVETYTNVIPQYVLLHFTYRFASKPKKNN